MIEEGFFFKLIAELFPPEDRIEPLDSGDADAGGLVYLVRFQLLDNVFFGEFVRAVWRNILLELLERLASKVRPLRIC
jgi:hypothetical protein